MFQNDFWLIILEHFWIIILEHFWIIILEHNLASFETYRRCVVSLSKTLYSPKVLVNTQEAVAPSRHDWKIVDWDVKPQPKQTNNLASVVHISWNIAFYMLFVHAYIHKTI